MRLSKFRLIGLTAVLIALLAVIGGLIISWAAGERSGVQVLIYNDRVRFVVQDDKVTIMRAEVFDLGGKRLYDSGPVMGRALDWAMITEAGERVAHGVYLYVITAWDDRGELVRSQVGKLALVPGNEGLGQAPMLVSTKSENALNNAEKNSQQVKALTYDHTGDWTVSGKLGVGTDTPADELHVVGKATIGVGSRIDTANNIALVGDTPLNGGPIGFDAQSTNTGDFFRFSFRSRDVGQQVLFTTWDSSASMWREFLVFTLDSGLYEIRSGVNNVAFLNSGNVGIGTSNPTAKLEVKGSTTNLLVLKDPNNNTVFRVERDGDVYADRAYYCGLGSGCFNAGTGADVAERIDTTESVGPGDVVEIDPQNPGFYRKAREPYSTRVAGVISTAPAITLGNNFDPKTDKWSDARPLLALAGRVPVKVTTENGPIKIGDFLTTSSKPGYAMRCSDLSRCIGATLGKALESLEEGEGIIMVQVMLR